MDWRFCQIISHRSQWKQELMGKPHYRIWNSITCLQKQSPKMPIISSNRKMLRSDPQKKSADFKKKSGRLQRSYDKSASYFQTWGAVLQLVALHRRRSTGGGEWLSWTHQMTSAVKIGRWGPGSCNANTEALATATPNIHWGKISKNLLSSSSLTSSHNHSFWNKREPSLFSFGRRLSQSRK